MDVCRQLLEMLEPRLVLSGHTHHGCRTLHTHPPQLHQVQGLVLHGLTRFNLWINEMPNNRGYLT